MSDDTLQAQSEELSPQEQFRQQALDYHEFPIPAKLPLN